MNKNIFIMLLAGALYAQPCLPEKYQDLIKTIDKTYKKQKETEIIKQQIDNYTSGQ